jgi:hypothetical protein
MHKLYARLSLFYQCPITLQMKRKINCLIPEALGEQLDSHFIWPGHVKVKAITEIYLQTSSVQIGPRPSKIKENISACKTIIPLLNPLTWSKSWRDPGDLRAHNRPLLFLVNINKFERYSTLERNILFGEFLKIVLY